MSEQNRHRVAESVLKFASANLEFRQLLVAELTKQGAKDKVPVFSKFERVVTVKDLEKLVLRSYPTAIPGTLEIQPEEKPWPPGAYVNFTMKDRNNTLLTGSVIIRLSSETTGVRVWSFVNIDSK